ncbi:MAG: hypothetical protein Q7P63_00460 [Verrucomicrobiota bacterium JB022]|nr:hypothetical protein [Verrucomicrobiota bacterium JB022]
MDKLELLYSVADYYVKTGVWPESQEPLVQHMRQKSEAASARISSIAIRMEQRGTGLVVWRLSPSGESDWGFHVKPGTSVEAIIQGAKAVKARPTTFSRARR